MFKFWKNVVIEETNKEGKKSSSSSEERKIPKVVVKPEKSDIIMVENAAKSGPSGNNMKSNSECMKIDQFASSDKGSASEKLSLTQPIKVEKTMKAESRSSILTTNERSNVVETIKVEEKKISFAKKPLIPAGPPKLTSMIKCNDPLRDKLRELLLESFSKVHPEASEDERDEVRNILDEISACDPIRVAVTVESAMFEKLGRSNGSHKVKYRSIMFNLKDPKNTDLRRRVLLGDILPEKLISMTAEEMASDTRKLSNKKIQEKALLECERAGAPKATTDQFRCGRCGQRKCTYYQLQTRSADEPMTTFVTCVNCNNHWKFC